ncbi:MAG: branched-chain amino acid ABC transporter permease [Actinobacteria bacterium]|nr:branched-chain amino acid ABC transporter permease [Actinomycetota bacterium]
MANFLQQVVSGLATGGIYGSLALALVLIYRATRVINFAQGEMGMFATFIALWLIESGWPYWGAFFATLAIAFVGGVVVERVVIRPVERAPAVTVVIITIGLLIGLNGAAFWIWGGETRAFPSAFSTRAIHVGGVAFSIQDLGVIGVSLAAVGLLYVFFRFTKLGLGLRAAALNPEASRLVGVRVGWMLALGWGFASVLGALSGMMVAPLVFLDPNMMRAVLLYALAAAILGGLDSPIGAVVGGLVLGVGLNLISTYVDFIGDQLKLPVAFAVILAVLLVKPTGLFGRTTVRRV